MATYKPKKKIDNNGTLDDIKFPMDSIYGLSDEFKKKGVHFISDSDITVTSGSLTSSEKWVVNGVDGITEPFDGMMIATRTPSKTIYSGTGTDFSINGGAKYYSITVNSDKLSDQYGANITVFMTFNSSRSRWEIADVDKAVKYSNVTNDSEYSVALKNGTGAGYSNNVTINPSKGRLSATELRENGVSLADKYALKDEVSGGSSRTITSINVSLQAQEADENGINCFTNDNCEIEFDGGSEYSYPPTSVLIPIAAGEGIEFVKSERNMMTINATGGSGEGSAQMLYRHDITLYESGSDRFDIGITIINTSSVAIDTVESVKNTVGLGKTINATGSYYGSSEGAVRSITFFDNYMTVNYGLGNERSDDYTSVDATINDTITEIGVAGGGSTTSLFGEWTTVTSGNLYLPSAGLYEIKVVLLEYGEPRTMTFFVDWDGSSPSYSQASLYEISSNDSISIISVDDTGLLEYYNTDNAYDTDNIQSISYRKVNEQISAGGSSGGGTPLVEITYDELKALRDGGQLVAGQKYRITDYNCTTTQENTQSAGHAFDIIVEALSNNTLSENASAIQHGGSGGGSPQFNPEVLADSEGTLVEGAIVSSYYYFEDFNESTGEQEGYKSMDEFIAYTYLENNDGVVVPVIYKTDANWAIEAPEEFDYPDTEDTFFYDGTMEVDGTTYDKWRKIEPSGDTLTWDGDAKVWALTNVVVTSGGSASDPYFANCKLSAWEIKYSIDNDKTRFWWADETNGTGVIYYMKDEYGNECPYDFKNIQFDREGTYYYTFSWVDENEAVKDLSIVGNTELYNDEGRVAGCFGNKMGILSAYEFGFSIDTPTNLASALNDNVFISTYSYEDGFFYGCISNTIGNNSRSNTFEDNSRSNTIGNYCNNNTFGYDCRYNTFGDYCGNNTIGKNSNSNTFGKFCRLNIFGDDCHKNIVDDGVQRAQPQTTGTGTMQGVHIHFGVSGQFTVARGVSYTQDVRRASDVTITV